jgi:hypothetical protein
LPSAAEGDVRMQIVVEENRLGTEMVLPSLGSLVAGSY